MKNPEVNCQFFGIIGVRIDFVYQGKPELCAMSLETGDIGGCIAIKRPNLRTFRKLPIKELKFDKLSSNFVKDCTDGKFALEFNNIKIEFVADSNDSATAVECRKTFGNTLLTYKSSNNYGNKVHDLSLPNLSSTMPPATSPFSNKKHEVKTPFSANGDFNVSNGSPHKNNRVSSNRMRLPYFKRSFERPRRNSSWGPNDYKRTRENDSANSSNGVMDSDEENNIQGNTENRLSLSSKKATYKDDDFNRRKSISCHVQNTTPPNSNIIKNRFYGNNNYSQDTSKRFSNQTKSSFTPPSKRQSLLSIDSAPKKSKLDFEVDNKENEGERQSLPIGFPNLGNTCYINAGLTATFAAITGCSSGEVAFMNFAQKMNNKDHVCQNFCRLLSLSKKSQSENLCESIEETLRSFKSGFQKQFPEFSGNHMEDCHEFLSELFNLIGTDPGSNRINDLIKVDSWNMPISKYFFQYTTKQIKKCTNCSAETSNDQTFIDCAVNVLKAVNEQNIQSSLAFAFKNSSTDGKCEKCQFSGCTLSSKIIQLPRIFFVFCKRYVWDGNAAKTCDTLKAPKYITLDPHCDQNAALSILPEEYQNIDETYGGVNGHTGFLNGYSNGCASDSINNGSGESKSDIVNGKNSDINENNGHFNENNGHVNEKDGDVNENNGDVNEKNGDVNEKNGDVNEKNGDVYENNGDVNEKNGDVYENNGHVYKNNGHVNEKNGHVNEKNGHVNEKNGHVNEKNSDVNEENGNVNENNSDPNEKNSDANDIEFLENVELEDEDEAIERAKRMSLEFEAITVKNNNDEENNANENDEDIKISKELRDNFLTGTLPHSYRLISCIRHNGTSTSGGHYVSYSYDVQRKKYFCFDDSYVSEISEETFYSNVSGGYIFMYLNNGVCLDNISRCSEN